jgi:hypothetical protein
MGLQNIMNGADDVAEYDILDHMNENGKFVLPVGVEYAEHTQRALERLMLLDWIRLIDIAPVPTAGLGFALMRVFIAMPAARDWHALRKAS